MKPIFSTLILVSAFVPAACVTNTTSQTLPTADRAELRSILPSADLSNLTPAQEGALSSVLHGNDQGRSKRGIIRAILN
ncbi:MAG: hypothetical protein WBC68_12670 [Albidovulum sp.]